MKRSLTSGRSASPTNTTYSGISNYRTESYRPIKDAAPLDPRLIARTHFEELNRYLASYLAKEPANSRSTARQKLTRLTRQQFQELSTDVYDELVRRKNNADTNDIPFLPVRDDFHPKRNQARQKLATLPTSRFKDLSSDVYYELARRYPEFKEETENPPSQSPGSTYDDYPSPDFPTSPRSKGPTPPPNPRLTRTSDDRDRPGSTGTRRRPSEDDFGSSNRRSEDPYGGVGDDAPFPPSSRRRPSEDLRQDPAGRRPSAASASDSTSTTNAQSATAKSQMIIPNKSTIAEEDIEVPYGRDARESGSTAGEEPDPDEMEGGLSALTRRLGSVDEDAGGRSGGDDYYDKMSFGRASVASDRSLKNGRASVGAGEEHEKMRRDYEFKIATMQSRIAGLEREVEGAGERERRRSESDERVQQLEAELDELRRRAEEQSAAMLAMQKELADAREDHERTREREARRAREDEDELQILRERCERLEDERAGGIGGANPEIMDQLRSDMEGLLAEVSDLSRRNDELMTSKDSDLVVIRDMDIQLKDYKRKYEQAKTELRSLKATSQIFLQTPKFDEQLPMSQDGGIPDIHVTAFLTAIDNLLSAGRSNAPTRVLTPMKAVVNAVSAIVDDVRAYERRPRRDRAPEADLDLLHALRERAEATLGNLVAASKTHATSSGLSPVSLLDAAASHVSAAVTEIGRAVFIRRATKQEQEQYAPAPAPASASNGFSPTLRSVEETKPAAPAQRTSSSSASNRRVDRSEEEYYPLQLNLLRQQPSDSAGSPSGRTPFSGRSSGDGRFRKASSERSSSAGSSPPPIFDRVPTGSTTGVLSDDSAVAEGSEDAWTELKPYLEAQTESIVYAIQSVLSGVRSPTPSPTLNENLTQIITIVSSIVAVCHDNLPPASAQQGNDILRELSDHANKLSEVQAMPEVTKESRQIMAKSSFAIANAMKGLMKL